jgi:hypothetical protein
MSSAARPQLEEAFSSRLDPPRIRRTGMDAKVSRHYPNRISPRRFLQAAGVGASVRPSG